MNKLLATLLVCIPVLLCAQENDFQAWYSIEAGVKVGDKWAVGISNEIRTDYNASVYSKNLIDLGVEYELSKRIDAGLFIRNSTDYPTSHYRNSTITFFGMVQYSKKFDRIEASARFRTGSDEYKNMLDAMEWEHREKIKLSYNLKGLPLTPEASIEFFFPVSRDFTALSKTRLLAGFSWRPKSAKNHRFMIQYGWQHKYNTTIPQNDFILCLGYKFTIKPFEKTK